MRAPLLFVPVLALLSTPARAATDVSFSFDDERLLQADEREGGLVHLTEPADEPRGLLVFLHGINERGPLHRGLGAGSFDVRAIVDELAEADHIEPVLVAGPSQTRDAWTGSRLWADFDLDRFVAATEQAAGVKVDRGRIVLVGHSGAGCNPTGGLLSPRGKIVPRAIVPTDVCMDDRFGKLFAQLTAVTAVHVLFQDAIWPREIGAFKGAFFAAADPSHEATVTRYDAPSANPHEEVVRVGLRDLLPRVLPPIADE